jgi:hypothetical protein
MSINVKTRWEIEELTHKREMLDILDLLGAWHLRTSIGSSPATFPQLSRDGIVLEYRVPSIVTRNTPIQVQVLMYGSAISSDQDAENPTWLDRRSKGLQYKHVSCLLSHVTNLV